MSKNVAKDVLWPTDPKILVRVAMLYVGQGDSSIVFMKDGSDYQVLVVDINKDKEGNGGIRVPDLMKDLLAHKKGKLDVFVNTHPHNDHLDDITELSEEVDIHAVWHSDHIPGKDDRASYDELQKVIKKVTKKHGKDAEVKLLGSRSATKMGEAEYYVLAPAKHVRDDVNDETAETRRRRIHEQCAVLKFGKGKSWIMLTGDADRDAWEQHITKYHKERCAAQILSASHHGSRSFFRYDKKDDPYLTALETIDPEYVIVSAPKVKESRHDHPHEDAMGYYEDHVGKDNVLHTGAERESYICDIFTDGKYVVNADTELVEAYGGEAESESKDEKAAAVTARAITPAVISPTRIDQRPMGRE